MNSHIKRTSRTRRILLNEFWETMKNTTLHGIPNIINNPFMFVKITWSIFLVCSTCYCFYSNYICVIQYLKYPVVTQFEIKYESQLSFPMVKICAPDFGMPYVDMGIRDNFDYYMAAQYMRTVLKTYPEVVQKNLGIKDLGAITVSCIFNLQACNLTQGNFFLVFNFKV